MRSRVGCMYKFFLQFKTGVNNVLPRYSVRLKSSTTIGEIVPVLNTNSQLPISSTFFLLKNEYRVRQIAFDHQLQSVLEKGIDNYKQKDFQKACLNFKEIIKALTGDEIADLSGKQKLILATAFIHSAKILNLGNTSNSKLALTYVEQAVKLAPDYEEAISMRNSLVAEYKAYRP